MVNCPECDHRIETEEDFVTCPGCGEELEVYEVEGELEDEDDEDEVTEEE
jgi:Zn finger protein HypA/HybF involved in hydrogenase expression